MIVKQSELHVVIDVDETLISVHKTTGDELQLDYYGYTLKRYTMEQHVQLLKSYKTRGYTVTVWSANGWYWAKQAIHAMNLTEYVSYVQTKPLSYVDDKDANDWMTRVFINE